MNENIISSYVSFQVTVRSSFEPTINMCSTFGKLIWTEDFLVCFILSPYQVSQQTWLFLHLI